MKSLVECTPREFIKQTNRIRKEVANWLELTDILKIRSRRAKLTPFMADMTDEEKVAMFAENKRLAEEQTRRNTEQILDELLDRHSEETLRVLALCCFVEPENIDDHTVDEYLEAFTKLVNNRAVFDFFTSLMQLDQMSTSIASKQ